MGQVLVYINGLRQGQKKPDVAVFTESAAVKVSYILLRLSTPSRHKRAIGVSVKTSPTPSPPFIKLSILLD
jgi:hypothetical protein